MVLEEHKYTVTFPRQTYDHPPPLPLSPLTPGAECEESDAEDEEDDEGDDAHLRG